LSLAASVSRFLENVLEIVTKIARSRSDHAGCRWFFRWRHGFLCRSQI